MNSGCAGRARNIAGAFRLAPTDVGAYPLIEGEAPREQLVFSLPLRAYVKPGGVFYFGAVRRATAGSCAFFISYSAHYVDSP